MDNLTSADACLLGVFLQDVEKFFQSELRRAYKDKDAARKKEIAPLLQVAQLLRRRLEA